MLKAYLYLFFLNGNRSFLANDVADFLANG